MHSLGCELDCGVEANATEIIVIIMVQDLYLYYVLFVIHHQKMPFLDWDPAVSTCLSVVPNCTLTFPLASLNLQADFTSLFSLAGDHPGMPDVPSIMSR